MELEKQLDHSHTRDKKPAHGLVLAKTLPMHHIKKGVANLYARFNDSFSIRLRLYFHDDR